MAKYQTMYSTHVFLGPTLDVTIAQKHLSKAHYHPPIKCGDLLKLLRLNPERVLIIDGYYEFTPAVWHKEIMLALDCGVEVWGASSMGALRAAELYRYGMKGIGDIFQTFAEGTLNDDDEVAVLHKGKEEHFLPVNDAMVNIRATLTEATHQGVISDRIKEQLLLVCKKKFYPERSLVNAIEETALAFPEEGAVLADWLLTHGLVDLKKNDAIKALDALNASTRFLPTALPKMPMTKFLCTLLEYSDTTPFDIHVDWLPNIEKKLQVLFVELPEHYRLLSELANLLKNLAVIARTDTQLHTTDYPSLLDDMIQNKLYNPSVDFHALAHHPHQAFLYTFICKQICLQGISQEMIEEYLPSVAVFYDIPLLSDAFCVLRAFLVVMFILSAQFDDSLNQAKKSIILSTLTTLARKRGYTQEKIIHWLNPSHINSDCYSRFISCYLKINLIHQGMNDALIDKEIEAPDYFQWIYDAYSIYQTFPVEAAMNPSLPCEEVQHELG